MVSGISSAKQELDRQGNYTERLYNQNVSYYCQRVVVRPSLCEELRC